MAEINGHYSLLLVDDNPTNLTLLAKIIELDLPEVRVLTASSGMEALQLVEREQVDGAFIDVQMPQMSGLEVCRRIKTDPRTADMPLVLITAHLATPEMRAEGLEFGAYDFISQPISNIEMLARIKVMLRLCQGERLQRHDNQQPDEDYSIRIRWLSGLLLSGDGPQATPDQALLRTLAGEQPEEDLDEQLLVEQLAGKFPLAWRRTFSKLALLDSIPVALARKLSEVCDIEAIFDYLQRYDLILQPSARGGEIFCFKPQARELLRERCAQTLQPRELQQMYLFAADWYRQRNDLTAAFDFMLRAEQYPAISQLFSQEGLAMLAGKWQPQVLQLLAQIPEEEAVRCGWLALFTGVGYMHSRPLEVETWLELARSRFVAGGDQRGELLVLSQQILQYLIADGQQDLGLLRLERLRQLAEQQLEFLDPLNRLKVLFAQGLAELFFAGCLPRCEEVLTGAMHESLREKLPEQQLDLHLLQALLALFQGRLRVARAAMEQGRDLLSKLAENSLSAKCFWIVACELLFVSGELDTFFRQRRFARQTWGQDELQQSAFGPLLNCSVILCLLAEGNTVTASEQLELALVEGPATTRPHFRSWFLQLRGLINALTDRFDEALTDSEQGLELRARVDEKLNSLPNLLLAGATAVVSQRYQAATELLQTGLARSVELGEERYRSGFHAWTALLHHRCGKDSPALTHLEELFAQLRRQNIDFFFALTPGLIRELAPLAAGRVDWSGQLQQLAQRWLDCGITDDGRLVPLIKLQLLGGFRMRLDGQDFELSEVGQASRQLLALLVTAPNRSLSVELLMGSLWPNSPPSKARNSFDTALSRLRKSLEGCFGKQIRQDYLVSEKGMLQLRYAQVDAGQVSTALESARRHLQRGNLWQAEQAFWQADRYWTGEFLVGFELEAELPYLRDQFNQLRLEQLEGLARLLLLRGDRAEALRLLKTGLQLEPTHDVLVKQLLEIYQQQEDHRAGRQLLDNYRKALLEEEYDPLEIDELIATLSPQRLEF